MAGQVRIEFRNVSLSFGVQKVFEKLDLQVISSEKLVFVGPSGAGKTCMLKMMAGLLPPTSGEVRIDGVNIYSCIESERQRLMTRMGMLFQKSALFDSLTCAENVAFPLREATTLPEKEITKKVHSFLEAVGIAHAKDLFPDEISGGMQKRLGIARALALGPKIIFYDDPTAGLDPITSRKIIDLILQVQKESESTVIAITNDINRAYQMADRMALICEDTVILTGSPSQTKNHPDKRVQQFVRGLIDGPLTDVS